MVFCRFFRYQVETVRFDHAHVAQLVEHILGKDEVTGSIPVVSSKELTGYFREHRMVDSVS